MKIAFLLILGGEIRMDQIQRFRYVSELSVFMECEQRIIICFLFQEGASSANIHSRLKAQFANASHSFRSTQHWCTAMSHGHDQLRDEDWSGRPHSKI
jgi:hypothetical protein